MNSPQNKTMKIGFIGAGNMAKALCKGFIQGGKAEPGNIIVSRRTKSALQEIATELGVKTTCDNVEVVKQCQVLFLAVKPHLLKDVLTEISSSVTSHHLVISVAMAWSIDLMEKMLPAGCRVVRTIPNTPAFVQCGATVYCSGQNVTTEDGKLVEDLFSSVGLCLKVEERMMSAVNGINGCGPAFLYMAIEALADGGVKMGVPRDIAQKLAAQAVMGAGKMALESGKHPGQLKDAVCSPGGATICGVHTLERGGFRNSLIDAVEASATKAADVETKLTNDNKPLT